MSRWNLASSMVAKAGVASVTASATARTVAGRRGRIAAASAGGRRCHGVGETGGTVTAAILSRRDKSPGYISLLAGR